MSQLNVVLRQLETEFEADPVFARTETVPTEIDRWWADLASSPRRTRRSRKAREARSQLIVHFAPLVTIVATRLIVRLPGTVELGDLVSYGMFGLIDAIEKFEPERGFKFETYAGTRIRGAIIDELRAADWVPRSVRSKARAVETATRSAEQVLRRQATDRDVASRLGWEVSEVRTVRAQVALSHVAALDGMPTLHDHPREVTAESLRVPGAGSFIDRNETFTLLRHAMEGIKGRDQEVLRLYYFEDLTLGQIGKILGDTESRVSQNHTAAVAKLRQALVATGGFA
ncbi:MAG: FliA/WhiG family RNA polymerase sigma factor [Demequinaceae bacterium]|nr:FliA/WhiG family RNA polymerase sigma factor [Demequinaceae bacterium]